MTTSLFWTSRLRCLSLISVSQAIHIWMTKRLPSHAQGPLLFVKSHLRAGLLLPDLLNSDSQPLPPTPVLSISGILGEHPPQPPPCDALCTEAENWVLCLGLAPGSVLEWSPILLPQSPLPSIPEAKARVTSKAAMSLLCASALSPWPFLDFSQLLGSRLCARLGFCSQSCYTLGIHRVCNYTQRDLQNPNAFVCSKSLWICP